MVHDIQINLDNLLEFYHVGIFNAYIRLVFRCDYGYETEQWLDGDRQITIYHESTTILRFWVGRGRIRSVGTELDLLAHLSPTSDLNALSETTGEQSRKIIFDILYGYGIKTWKSYS